MTSGIYILEFRVRNEEDGKNEKKKKKEGKREDKKGIGVKGEQIALFCPQSQKNGKNFIKIQWGGGGKIFLGGHSIYP